MKCINKFFSIVLVFVLPLVLLTGCGKGDFPLKYSEVRNINSNAGIEEKTESFSKKLAIVNSDIPGKFKLQLESAQAAGLFNVSKKEVLYAKDVHAMVYPASLTKIMTALVALKHSNMDDVITCGPNVKNIDYDSSKLGVNVGDQMTMNQALHALILSSANDVAIAIAEHIAGSVEEFCNMMNAEALSLGASNTNFVNPHGLSDNNHYTTVYDLYLITAEAIKYATFNEIISVREYDMVYNDVSGAEISKSLSTTNLFLREKYKAPDNVTIIGGKTGTTLAAGNCLILEAKDSQGDSYVAIIMKSSQRDTVNIQMQEMLKEINKS